MNTWGYLILIAALLLLAAAMLYARFASRSREKSLHHSPVELMFPYDTISAARPIENETGRIELPRGGEKSGPGLKMERVSPSSVIKEEVKGETKNRESEYFDELQEAAAGLAILMRSSPVGRSEPVIYAPEEAEAESAEVVVEIPADLEEVGIDEIEAGVEPAEALVEGESEEIIEVLVAELEEVVIESIVEGDESEVMAQSGLVLDESLGAVVVDEMVTGEESAIANEPGTELDALVKIPGTLVNEPEEFEVALPVEVRVLTMREILGDQVSDRIEEIDEGLDALEALVRSIESSLRALDSVDLVDEDEELAEADGAVVSEAA